MSHIPYWVVHAVLACLLTFSMAQTFPDPGNCRAIANPDPKFTCGVSGTPLNDPVSCLDCYTDSVSRTDDLVSCRNLCLRRRSLYGQGDGCGGFSYNSKSRSCTIFEIPPRINANASSSVKYYVADCFDCPTLCPSKAGSNAIDNGGFEAYASNVAPWARDFDPRDFTITSPGRNSSRALQAPHLTTGFAWDIKQFFNTCPDTLYRLSFDYRFRDSAAKRPGIQLLAGDLQYNSQTDQAFITGTWATFTDFISPSASYAPFREDLARLRLMGFASDAGDLDSLIDNVVITPFARALVVRQGASEMFHNPGFETGKLAPWTKRRLVDEVYQEMLGDGKVICANGSTQCVFRMTSTKDYGRETIELTQIISGLQVGARYLLAFDYAVEKEKAFSFTFGPSNYDCTAGAFQPPELRTGRIKRPVIARNKTETFTVTFDAYGAPTNVDNFSLKLLA